MHFFRRLRRFLAFVCLGAAGMLVLDGDPSGAPVSAPGYSAEQSFIGEESDGVAATTLTTAPAPEAPVLEPAPESARVPADETIARALAEQNRALQTMVTALNGTLDDVQSRLKSPPPTLWTGVPSAPIGAGIAVPLLGQAPSVVTELKTEIDRLRTRVDRLAPPVEPAAPWKGLLDRDDVPSARRVAPPSERLVAELTGRLFPTPPRLDAMRLSHNSLEMTARGRHPAR